MNGNDKQHYIYIRSTKERIPVSEDEFKSYYHDIDLFRQRQQYHGMCVCPAARRLECDMDCAVCPFHRAGAFLSLNKPVQDEDGHETEWCDLLEDPASRFDESLANLEQLQELLHRLSELMPEAIEIGYLRLQGFTDTQIAKRLGVHRQTMSYRLKRLHEQIKKEFPEVF